LKVCSIRNGSPAAPLPVTTGALVGSTLPQRLPYLCVPFAPTVTTTKPACDAGVTAPVSGSTKLPRNSPYCDPVKATPIRAESSDDTIDSGSPVICAAWAEDGSRSRALTIRAPRMGSERSKRPTWESGDRTSPRRTPERPPK
jgi:hypothetical protein